MRIESVRKECEAVTVLTTGACFQFLPAEIRIATRLPSAREVLVLKRHDKAPWQVLKESPQEIQLRGGEARVSLGDDSFLQLRADDRESWNVLRLFDPVAGAENEQVSDFRGEGFGVGLYRLGRTDVRKSMQDVSREDPLFVHPFPPRPEDQRRLRQVIAHEGRPRPGFEYPSDGLIRSCADHADILALHAYFWHEEDRRSRPRFSRYHFRPCPWFSARHEPSDPEALVRVMKTCREHGMLFVPYVSPRYSRAPDMLAELTRLQNKWDFDGFYLDGLRGDFLEQRQFVRDLRERLGPERVIYLNGTDQPFGHPCLTAPFIDSHCDFVLRGDSGRGDLDRDAFLRRAVSGRGAGNQVGVWCHYGSSGFPFPFDRVPSEADQRAAHAAGARIWRRSFWWPGSAALRRFDAVNRSFNEGVELPPSQHGPTPS